MAPPVTPSPHRFLAGNRRAASPTKNGQALPASRPQYRASSQHDMLPSQSTSSQFAPTPRFGKIKPSSQRPPSPPKPALAQALRASIRPTETVEEASAWNEDDEMLDNEQSFAIPTTEGHDAPHPWTNEFALSPKRRRLEVEESFSSPDREPFKHPQTPASHFAKSAPRVQHPPTQDSISTLTSTTAAPRPAFLRPSIVPSEPSEPLPDAFSPHRRGQKYVPGGMASTVQQWVFETGQAAVQSRKGQGYLRGEDYVMRIRVESMRGDGPRVVVATTANGETVDLVLAGAGDAAGSRAHDTERGSLVGIRAPTWEIDVDGRPYTVAVDWRVLT